MAPLTARGLLQGGLQIAIILFAAYFIGGILHGLLSELGSLSQRVGVPRFQGHYTGSFLNRGAVVIGLGLAVLHTLTRVRILATDRTTGTAALATDPQALIHEVGVLAPPVLLWFGLAGLVSELLRFEQGSGLVGTVTTTFSQTGMLTVLLYDVAHAIGLVNGLDSGRSRTKTE